MACSAAKPAGTATGDAAPSFSRTDLAGQTITMSHYRGKVVLLNFWATWCGPCLAEIPTFIGWQKQFGARGLQILGVSMDDDVAPARATYRRYRIDYPVIMGDARLGLQYGGILGLPVTFLIDRNGKIAHVYSGPIEVNRTIDDIQKLLATPTSPAR
jgi:peroxiredoxin